MAGDGVRVQTDMGRKIYKPFIEVGNTPIYMRAVQSALSLVEGRAFRLTFLIKKSQDLEFDVQSKVLGTYPEARFAIIEDDTYSVLETCHKGMSLITEWSSFRIFVDCDLAFSLEQDFNHGENFDGSLFSFTSSEGCYSYASVDNEKIVLECVEKKVISSHALAGVYCFFRWGENVDAMLGEVVDKTDPSKQYFSFFVDQLIKNGARFKLYNLSGHESFGTLEELSHYENVKI